MGSPCPQSGDELRECGQRVLRSSPPALGGRAAGGGERQEGVCRAVCRGAHRAAEENHRGNAHQQDRVCRVHQVSSASSDEGGRRRSRRLENCSSPCCRCCCLGKQNMDIKEKKSRITSIQIISAISRSCSKRPSINKGKDATNRIWIPIVLPFTDVDKERLRKNK